MNTPGLYKDLTPGQVGASRYLTVEARDGSTYRRRTGDGANWSTLAETGRLYRDQGLTSRSGSDSTTFEVQRAGRAYVPRSGGWRTGQQGIARLAIAERLLQTGDTISYKKYFGDFSCLALTNFWDDVSGGITSRADPKVYVVQTAARIIERCVLMTTSPGDLVLDPTCGSGTTAYTAENWGRRWITIDVSRVALAIARQRLLTAKYDYYQLRPTSAEDVQRNPNGTWLSDPAGQIQGSCTFDCKTVPHITLKSIARNQALDPIFEKWQPVLDEKLTALNAALQKAATTDLRQQLAAKLRDKQKQEGKRAITDADERRWLLPPGLPRRDQYTTVDQDFGGWYEWEVPFDSDPDWPKPLQNALTAYRKAWREKMDEVNACIAARADQEELVDQPDIDRSKVRVAGPFTVEGVIPAEDSIAADEADDSPIDGAPEALDTFGDDAIETDAQNTEAYLDRMVRLLRGDGVRFSGNKVVRFTRLEALADGSILHAEGNWDPSDDDSQVAVMFGPQYGALIAPMVEEGIRFASRRGYDDLVFAAFSFDGAAQAAIQDDPDPHVRIHMAQIRPDVNMGDLLKTTSSSQIFTVSGMPRTSIDTTEEGDYVVHMEGVDMYDPVTNTVQSTGAGKVAAWFLDTDYDGRCFCITQAFFPDRAAWSKLAKALGDSIDSEAFEKLSGTVSLPFAEGTHRRAAIKVIDPRGNEVLRVHRLGASYV